jgi:hypothetical protein
MGEKEEKTCLWEGEIVKIVVAFGSQIVGSDLICALEYDTPFSIRYIAFVFSPPDSIRLVPSRPRRPLQIPAAVVAEANLRVRIHGNWHLSVT